MSDLSGYEEEYVMIKRLVSDKPGLKFEKRHVHDSIRKKTYFEAKTQEQETVIRSLNSQKEDLEIQVHRLSVQLQNSVREKEVCQEQLDILQTKLNEKKQQEYFELMKDKVSLQGQNDALRQELKHYSLASADLDTKYRQSLDEIERLKKENVTLSDTEIDLRKVKKNLECENLKLKSDLKSLSDTVSIERNLKKDLKLELVDKENVVKDLELKIETQKQERDNYEEAINSLKNWNMEYSKREEQQNMEIKRLENATAELTAKLKSSKDNSDWYQLQVKKVQEQNLQLQNELTETKSSLSIVSADRDRCKQVVEKLNVEIEDNRVKAMRDKSLLLVQFEELEANIRERELALRHLEEGTSGSSVVKLSEDRYNKLEEDHQRLQELKIEMRDILRQNDSLKEEIMHKSFTAKKNEDIIRDLRKNLAVTQEKLGSKKVFIDSLNEKLTDSNTKLENSYEKIKEYESIMAHLKEQKLQLEATTLTAEQDKKQVDETIIKLREDMSKLTSNFFRMKHDLSAKDKQIESLTTEISELSNSKKQKSSQIEQLTIQLKEMEECKSLHEEIVSLNELLKVSKNEIDSNQCEINNLKSQCECAKVEKNSMTTSLKLRDEQIENMKGIIDTYKEKLLQKDDEIFRRKDQMIKLEKNLTELQKQLNNLKNEYQLVLQEKDEFQELERNYRNATMELKDSIKFEKRSKESWEKKFKEKFDELQALKHELEINVKERERLSELYHKHTIEKEAQTLKLVEMEKLNEEVNLLRSKLSEEECKVQRLSKELTENQGSYSAVINTYENKLKNKDNEVKICQETIDSKVSEIKKLELLLASSKNKLENKDVRPKPSNSVKTDRECLRQNVRKNKNVRNKRDDRNEMENFKQRLRETSNIVSEKDKEIEALKCSLLSYENLKKAYDQLKCEFDYSKNANEALKSENSLLSNRCSEFVNISEMSKASLVAKDVECNKWKLKFESLRDIIPQRDTNFSTKSINEHAVSQNNYHECVPSSSFQDRVKCLEEGEVGFQSFNLEEKVKFTQTMVYLQKQISLTAEALKNKDRQIMELNKQLNSLSPNSNSMNSQLLLNHRDSMNINYCDKSTSVDEDLNNPMENKNINELTSEIATLKETLVSKETEFKEKKRRYESNLRLLTRKLKEHMKGRRTAEKELEHAVQEKKQCLDSEEKKYSALKSRYIDLERKCKNLDAVISSRNSLLKEKDQNITSLENEIQRERESILQMQKEIGQMEEMKLCMDHLRNEINSLNIQVESKRKKISKMEESLVALQKEKESLEVKANSLSLKVIELTEALAEECNKNFSYVTESFYFFKVSERDKIINSKEDLLSKSSEDIDNLKQTLANTQLNCNHLEESLSRVQNEDINNLKKISLLKEDIEALKNCVDIKNGMIEDLQAKLNILEKELKVREENIDSLKSECADIKKQSLEREEKKDDQLAFLNKRLALANKMESSLNAKLASVHKEKMAYQSQCSKLKFALSSTLEKIKDTNSAADLPSPSPLNTEVLIKLMEQSSKPAQTNKLMNSLSERLHSLREEVAVLQSEIKLRDQ
ncbi:Golgin subfamily A member 3 [Armadillidium vulgare]|nr:Golgin subfamily A member 3 [Armadillidium vulgare]